MSVIHSDELDKGNLEGIDHGATISLILDDSEPGHGTVFKMYLTVATEPAEFQLVSAPGPLRAPAVRRILRSLLLPISSRRAFANRWRSWGRGCRKRRTTCPWRSR